MEHNKLVYIASPYSGDVERNVAFAKAACRYAMNQGVTVMVSAKAETANEATQKASLLVLPLVLLAVGQFTGLFFLTPVLLLGIGVVFLAAGLLLMRVTAQNFTAEKVLK